METALEHDQYQYEYADGSPAQHFYPDPPPGHYEPADAHLSSEATFPAEVPPFDVPTPPSPRPRPRPLPTRRGADPVFKKCPGAPKRFKSSYVHFFTHFVETQKHRLGPDGLPVKISISDVSKECSRAWKSLPVEQRQYWDYVSNQEKEEYIRQKAAYKGPWRVATGKVKKKNVGAPKRSPPAFFLYLKAKRPSIKARFPEMSSKEVVRACSEMWRASDSEKAPFQEEERRLRAQYHDQMQQWRQEHEKGDPERGQGEGGREMGVKEDRTTDRHLLPRQPRANPHHNFHNLQSARGIAPSPVAVHRSKKQKKDPNAPKKSPSAFFLFANHCRPELKVQYPQLAQTDLNKMLGQQWSEMAEEGKRPFRDHEEQLRRQYHVDLEHYRRGVAAEPDYVSMESPRF